LFSRITTRTVQNIAAIGVRMRAFRHASNWTGL